MCTSGTVAVRHGICYVVPAFTMTNSRRNLPAPAHHVRWVVCDDKEWGDRQSVMATGEGVQEVASVRRALGGSRLRDETSEATESVTLLP
jgi:hypothetical protein